MLIPSVMGELTEEETSLSRRVNANSQRDKITYNGKHKLIKKGEC